MTLRQEIVRDRVEDVARKLEVDNDEAFLRFVHSLVTDRSIYDFAEGDLVDGGQDKQIDVITIDEGDDEATIYLIQAKNTRSFSSNALIQMHNGLDWVFHKPRATVQQLSNTTFKDQIIAYRSVLGGLGPANMRLIVAFVTNGLTSDMAEEFRQEARAIKDEYDNDTFAQFELEIWGADELVNRLNTIESRSKKIDEEIRIRYDANNPSLIKYHAGGIKGVVCSASARELSRIVNDDPTESVFDSNVRRSLGTRGAVNSDILRTCTSAESSYLFWFLNNGVTIMCDSFDPVTDPDDPHVKIKNMQIVNGCQTATTLALAEKRGQLAPDTRVLLRIYETMDSDLVDRIVLTTNNQNKITNRNLKANDPLQADMEQAFMRYSYFYERKPRQYDDVADIDSNRIFINEAVAQSYLAVVLKKPSDARGRKYKVWGEFYNQIFTGQAIEPYVVSALLHRYVTNWSRKSGLTKDPNDLRRKLARYGMFQIARIAAFLWRGTDEWRSETHRLRENIRILEENPELVNVHLETSLEMLERIIKGDKQYMSDVDNALKAGMLDLEINRSLHQ